jgi:hypothetical protein
MNAAQREPLFQVHRDAERQRDFDGIMKNSRKIATCRQPLLGVASWVRRPHGRPTLPTSLRSRPNVVQAAQHLGAADQATRSVR